MRIKINIVIYLRDNSFVKCSGNYLIFLNKIKSFKYIVSMSSYDESLRNKYENL